MQPGFNCFTDIRPEGRIFDYHLQYPCFIQQISNDIAQPAALFDQDKAQRGFDDLQALNDAVHIHDIQAGEVGTVEGRRQADAPDEHTVENKGDEGQPLCYDVAG